MTSTAPRHVLLFDIDGTLVSTGGAGRAALEESLAQEFQLPQVRGNVPMSGRTDRAIIRDLFRAHDLVDSLENVSRLTARYLQRLPTSLASRPGRSLPGVAHLVAQLARRNDVALGLLTGNLRAGARLKLGHFDLFDFFAFGAFGDEHFDRDHVAAEALTIVRQRFDGAVSARNIWVIGDTPLDVQCARSIGARCVAVATGIHGRDELAAREPDLLVDDLADATLATLWA